MALRVSCAIVFLLVSASSRVSMAHGLTTAYLEIVETSPGQAEVVWKTPGVSHASQIVFDSRCVAREPEVEGRAARSQSVQRWHLRCPAGLPGTTLRIAGLGEGVSNAVVHVLLADGTTRSQVLTRSLPSFEIETKASWVEVGFRYLQLGVTHILEGWDHLLFLLGLVVAVRERRRLVLTISAFTLAHSVTLVATALGVLNVPSDVAEAAIAVSLVLLALDLPDLRAPAALALCFGLVHGLGFAGALAETGLPPDAIPAALVAFNLGVEVGQLLFVLALVFLGRGLYYVTLVRLKRTPPDSVLATGCAYLIGVTGVYLCFERVRVLVAGG